MYTKSTVWTIKLGPLEPDRKWTLFWVFSSPDKYLKWWVRGHFETSPLVGSSSLPIGIVEPCMLIPKPPSAGRGPSDPHQQLYPSPRGLVPRGSWLSARLLGGEQDQQQLLEKLHSLTYLGLISLRQRFSQSCTNTPEIKESDKCETLSLHHHHCNSATKCFAAKVFSELMSHHKPFGNQEFNFKILINNL